MGARAIVKPVIPWVGNKHPLLPYILKVLPPGITQFVDVFGGSGAVTLGLPPEPSRRDIYNDLSGDLVNFQFCIRDNPLALVQELGFLPLHSRQEFDYMKKFLRREPLPKPLLEPWEERELEVVRTCFKPRDADELAELLRGQAELRDVRRAAAYYKISRGSFSGTRNSFGVRPNNIRNFLYLIQEASRRLSDVVIEHQDGIKLIKKRDIPTGAVYCDPPYYTTERAYEVLFTKRDHVRLYHALHDCKGFVVLSYNDCPYIRNLYKDFFILAFSRNNPLAQKKGAEFGELIITNYDPRPYLQRQTNLFEDPTGDSGMKLVRIPKTQLKAA